MSAFTRSISSLVTATSTTTLPEGDDYLLVVQVKETAEAKPQNFRVKLAPANCQGCKRAEYACICEGHSH